MISNCPQTDIFGQPDFEVALEVVRERYPNRIRFLGSPGRLFQCLNPTTLLMSSLYAPWSVNKKRKLPIACFAPAVYDICMARFDRALSALAQAENEPLNWLVGDF